MATTFTIGLPALAMSLERLVLAWWMLSVCIAGSFCVGLVQWT